MKPSNQSLCRDYLRDLVVDIRCARRDGLKDYAQKCVNEFRTIWPTRHAPRIDRYGMPQPERQG